MHITVLTFQFLMPLQDSVVPAAHSCCCTLQASHCLLLMSASRFSSAMAAELLSVEVAQTAVNELKSSYNLNNSRCDAESWTQQYCAAAATSWAAYQTADNQLAAATASLAGVAKGPSATQLAEARRAVCCAASSGGSCCWHSMGEKISCI